MKLAVLVVVVALVSCASAAVFQVQVGEENSISFNPAQMTVQPGDTVEFVFRRVGDMAISAANNDPVCTGNPLVPSAAACQVATSPLINCIGPGSGGQVPLTCSFTFVNEGVFSVVNPTFCRADFAAALSCSAKATITVAQPVATPEPGDVIVQIGNNGQSVAFPPELTVNVGDEVWFEFNTLAGLQETDASGQVIPGGLSCPVVTSVGQFCRWVVNQERTFFYQSSPAGLGISGSITAAAPVTPPTNAFVVDVGAAGVPSFSTLASTIPVGSMVYFRFMSYGPHRVVQGDGPTCQPLVGGFDSGFQGPGRVFPVGVTTEGLTYFLDPTFCASNNMRSQVQAGAMGNPEDFVEVIVAPRIPGTQSTELVFDPNPVVIFQGGTVLWRFTDFGHTVTAALNNDMNTCEADPNGFDSGFVQPAVNGVGGTFTQTFPDLGDFHYISRPHCNQGMRGLVRVEPRPENVIRHGVPEDLADPNRFDPQITVVNPGDTVCWQFDTAGDVVEGEFWQDCIARPGGFNTGFQQVGTRLCRTFNEAPCTAFPFFDSVNCANGFFGIVVVSDVPRVQVGASNDVFQPQVLHVPVGSTVTWDIVAAGFSVTQAPTFEQFAAADEATRCAVTPGGFDSGVVLNAPQIFSQNFPTAGEFYAIDAPHCPFPAAFPNFFGTVRVCDPFVTRDQSTATPTPDPNQCPGDDPCKNKKKKTVINFYFADILNGIGDSGCSTCGN